MYEQDIGVRLQQRLASVSVPADHETQLEVKWLVWSFVDDRRAAGWPPERVVVALKRLAHSAGLAASPRVVDRNAQPTLVDHFLVEFVGWSIHRYYEPG